MLTSDDHKDMYVELGVGHQPTVRKKTLTGGDQIGAASRSSARWSGSAKLLAVSLSGAKIVAI
jgi:hypothetical protein